MTRPVIIVIDDDDAILQFLQILLTTEGYIIIGCTDSDKNAEYIHWLQPAALLLELHRPYLDATLTFLAEVRQYPATCTLPVLVSSTDRQLLRELGETFQRRCYTAFEKPFAIDWLVSEIHRLVHPLSA